MKIDLGCGPACEPGALGVDLMPYPGVAVVARAEGLPFKSESLSAIHTRHVLEHVDLVPTMNEIWRCLRPEGHLLLYVPHCTGMTAWSDPTHRRAFTYRTWDFFEEGTYGLPRFQIVERMLHWRPSGQFPRIDALVNRRPRFFEKYMAPLVGGCHEIYCLMKKV
jgi:SAM-dependent methyltransferase